MVVTAGLSTFERILALASDDAAGLARAFDGEVDWVDLSHRARGHGLFTLLVHECERAGVDVPATVRENCARDHAVASLWHAHLLSSLGTLGEIFSTAGLRVVALKGPLLAERIYPEGALRPSVDLDLLG